MEDRSVLLTSSLVRHTWPLYDVQYFENYRKGSALHYYFENYCFAKKSGSLFAFEVTQCLVIGTMGLSDTLLAGMYHLPDCRLENLQDQESCKSYCAMIADAVVEVVSRSLFHFTVFVSHTCPDGGGGLVCYAASV